MRGIWTAGGAVERSLMPTWLEYLRAQQPLALLLGTVTAAWTPFQFLLKWMKLEL